MEGWKLHSVITNEIGKNISAVSIGGITGGTNATVDEIILIFERMVSKGNLKPVPKPEKIVSAFLSN